MPASRKLTGRQVRDLLAGSAGAEVDPEISRLAHTRAHQLPDGGELLVFEDGRGRHYESRAALLAMLDEVSRQEPTHLLHGLLPLGRAFVDEAPRLAAEFAAEHGGLDGTERSLDDVDQLVRRRRPRTFLRPEQFQRLVAYVGEVIRAITGGEWRAELAGDGRTWEPWIVEPDGRRHAPFALVHGELAEWGRDRSIRGVVAGRLGPRQR